jgi:hypothetical protein
MQYIAKFPKSKLKAVAQALVLASQTNREELCYADHHDILSATAGVIFLATPHRGSAFSMLARYKMSTGSFFGVSTYSKLVSLLDLGSPTLNTLQENFQKIFSQSLFGNLQVYCFFETKEFAAGVCEYCPSLSFPADVICMQLVVEPESACIGIGGEQSFEANHVEMNKFGPSGRNYENYLLFLSQLLKMYDKGVKIVRGRFSGIFVALFDELVLTLSQFQQCNITILRLVSPRVVFYRFEFQ